MRYGMGGYGCGVEAKDSLADGILSNKRKRKEKETKGVIFLSRDSTRLKEWSMHYSRISPDVVILTDFEGLPDPDPTFSIAFTTFMPGNLMIKSKE
jgi:hypothetical protein